ncbi:hypothetical protein A2246_03670 [candidate division WOR-1 bacterium RIFOXYA2_FULL_37_7]|nr:MAG: hypothetical protein A2246_03670 [candidate division WOR-1 bacterium RIFOXYA2_FULL_37_7]
MLKKHDVVFVHVEAPDECGHMGDVKGKIKSISDFDEKIVGYLINKLKKSQKDFRMLVLPDHPTPIKFMTHTSDPVPFILYDSTKKAESRIKKFNEKELKKSKVLIKNGHTMMNKFLTI